MYILNSRVGGDASGARGKRGGFLTCTYGINFGKKIKGVTYGINYPQDFWVWILMRANSRNLSLKKWNTGDI